MGRGIAVAAVAAFHFPSPRFPEFPFSNFHEHASIGSSASGFPTFHRPAKQDFGFSLSYVYRK